MEMNSCCLAFICVLSHRISIEFTLVCLIGLQRRARLFTHEYYITGNRGGVLVLKKVLYREDSAPRSKPSPFTYHF